LNRKSDDQEKILDDIRQRVLEESENLKAEKEALLNEKVTLEALQEMTDLPLSRIREISSEVKKEHQKNNTPPYNRGSRTVRIALIAGTSILVACFVTIAIVNGAAQYRESVSREAFRKAEQNYRLLVNAVRDGKLELVEYLVRETGVPAELDGFESDSALMVGVKKSRSDIVTFLLENKADVLKKSSAGQSVMDVADDGTNIIIKNIINSALLATTPESDPVRTLWSNGYYYSERSFLRALDKKDVNVLKLYTRADQGIYANDYADKGILAAAKTGDLDAVKLLVAEGRDIRDNTKNLALLQASTAGHLGVIDFLLKEGADINFKYDLSHYAFEQDFTPLMCALSQDSRAAEYLLKKGADPNLAGSSEDLLPIMIPIAAIKNSTLTKSRLNQISLLIKYGADINGKNGAGQTPLEYAQILRSSEREPVIRLLIEAGARIPMTEEFFRELVYLNDLPHLQKFLEAGMDPNLGGFEYNDAETTALIKSVMLGYIELAKTLIRFGADVNFRTSNDRKTPLLMAVVNEDPSMVRLLLENGAKVDTDVTRRIESYYNWTNDPTQDSIRKLINANR